MSHTAALILAAGSSSRMSRPKQLLEIDGKPLVRRAAEAALASVCDSVIMVLGANADRIRECLQGLHVEIVENANWPLGMGTSIHTGMDSAISRGADAVILMLGDQPLVSAATLNRLIDANHTIHQPIVASQYAGTVGVPVYFEREFFADLLALRPEEGCKGLILKHPSRTTRLDCPEAEFDIDTPLDFLRVSEQLIKRDG